MVALTRQELLRAGRVTYGDRAFEQDAQEAMRGDIVRGLIELITNSDDAYARSGAAHGKIRIEVEHRRGAEWKVVVRDRASGMSLEELRARIIELGGRESGFEAGQAVRGTLGRGAKDLPAFGPTLYESIKNNQYGALRLLPTGEYECLPKPRKASAEDRHRLGIPRGSGTVVTVLVRSSVRCPNHGTLRRRLGNHFQLRDIMSDPKREVLLVNLNSGESDRLVYQEVASELLKKTTLEIAGYPEANAELEVRRLPERCDDPPSDPCRPIGLLVQGRRAIYENTLFSLEGNPHAAYLHGRIRCGYIDTLAREYDDRRSVNAKHPTNNLIPVISRARDGLRSEHPFYVELKASAEAVLEEIVREEEDRLRREAARMENENTRRDLERLAREAARFMEDELRNAEAEELPTGPGNEEAKLLSIVPGEAICYLDEDRTLSILARKEGLSTEATVSVGVDPEGVVELIDGNTVTLHPHRRRDDVLVGQIRLKPLVPDLALIQCECDGRLAEALVEVREERITPPPPEPPEVLEFGRPRYRVGWMKSKILTIRAPIELCEVGAVARISSDSPGIVVLTGQVPMEMHASAGYLEGSVRIEGRGLGSEGTMTAYLGSNRASCKVVVTREEDAPTIKFTLEDKDGGKYRALWEEREDPVTGDRVRVLEIQGRHPALRRYLGEAPEFPGQNTPWARALMAEIIADNVCREVARRVDALRQQEERPDSEGFYAEHYSRVLKLLPRLHALMVPAVPTDGER